MQPTCGGIYEMVFSVRLTCLLRVVEENVADGIGRFFVEAYDVWIKIPRRPWCVGEMAMTILTPHQRRAVPVADDLPHPCRHVVKRKADATIGREIWAGGVCQSPVVQRISPDASGIATVRTSSTSTAIFWPHVSMLFDSNLSSWGIMSPR